VGAQDQLNPRPGRKDQRANAMPGGIARPPLAGRSGTAESTQVITGIQ
jgi:hypothetical protein